MATSDNIGPGGAGGGVPPLPSFIAAADDWCRSVRSCLDAPADRGEQERAAVAVDRAEQATMVAWKAWVAAGRPGTE